MTDSFWLRASNITGDMSVSGYDNNNENVLYSDSGKLYRIKFSPDLFNKEDNVELPVYMLPDFLTYLMSKKQAVRFTRKLRLIGPNVIIKTTNQLLKSLGHYVDSNIYPFTIGADTTNKYFISTGSIFDQNMKPLLLIEGVYTVGSNAVILQKNIIKVDRRVMVEDTTLAKRLRHVIFNKNEILVYSGYSQNNIDCEIKIVKDIPKFLVPITYNENAEKFLKDNCESILQFI